MPPPNPSANDANITDPPSAVSDINETMVLAADGQGRQDSGFGPPVAEGDVGTLGPYRLVKELGKGGMGAVYAALDTRLERQIALKVMLPAFAANPQAKERFLREARAAAKITDDNVVTVYEADERQGVPYIAMQYLEGYPLDEFLKKKGSPSIAQIVRIGMETAAGLAAAHRIGLVHRDIKPGNLWLESPRGRVKVLDFGLAKPVDADVELTQSGTIVGTPAYMSPEQARGWKVDHRTDLFSLGGVLYRLCTGRQPFHGPNTMAVLMALGTEEPPAVRECNPAVPESLAALVHRLLAKNADARPSSAEDVVRQLRAIGGELSVPFAQSVAPSTSQPQAVHSQVVYVPIQVTAAEANPFADIDVTQPEAAPRESSRPKPRAERTKAGGRSGWLLAGGALAALVLGGVVIIIKNKDGSETKIEVPDDVTVTVKDQTGKTVAKVEPKQRPVSDTSVDRKAAEWAIAQGGVVKVNGVDRDITAAADLPKEKFKLASVSLYNKPVTDAGLAHLKDLKSLSQLELGGTKVTDAGLEHLKELESLTFLSLTGTPVTDAGLAQLKDLKSLTNLYLNDTPVMDAGLAHLKELESLTSLLLSGTKVTDAGLAHLKELKSLSQLELGGTKVTDAGLAQLKELKSLTWFVLNGTEVTDAGLAQLKELKSFTFLGLNGTKVTDAGLAQLKDLKSLTQLILTKTKVTAQGLADFHAAVPGCRIEHDGGVIEATDADRKAAEWSISQGGMVKVSGEGRDINAAADLPKEKFTLTEVNLSAKPVTDAGLAHLKQLKSLSNLWLDGTKVTDAGLAQLKELESLTGLGLGGTKLTDAGLAHLKQLNSLTFLSLTGTEVTSAGLAQLKQLNSLSHLWLSGTQVTDAGLAQLKELNSLKALDLKGTAVTDAGLVQLKELKNLTYLGLGGTKVTEAGLAHLKELKSLTRLDLKSTKVMAQGMADFHAAVPGCKIEHDGGVIEPK